LPLGDYPPLVGSKGQPLLQRTTTYDLLVALRNAGVEFDLSTLATQTTLALIKSKTDNLDTSLVGKLDVALSTRALEAGGNLASILAKLDVALSTRALEAGGNLAAILTALTTPTTVGTLADLTGNAGAQQLVAGATACKAVIVRALAANTTTVRVGDANVSASRGAEITAGDAVVIGIDNVNKVYFFAAATAKVSVTYVN
jgi:hypothetical protein